MTRSDQSALFADETEVTEDVALDLQEVTKLARELFAAQRVVDGLEEQLSEAKEHLNRLSDHDMPEAMGDLMKIELTGGYKVELKSWIRAKDSPEAQDWLTENGRGGVIKDVVTVAFDRGEHEEAKQLCESLYGDGYAAEERMSIHNGTLRAELRRMLEEGVEFPRAIFQMEEGLRAKITSPK